MKKLFIILTLILGAQSTYPFVRSESRNILGEPTIIYHPNERVQDWRRPFAGSYNSSHNSEGIFPFSSMLGSLQKLVHYLAGKEEKPENILAQLYSKSDERQARKKAVERIKKETNKFHNQIISIAKGKKSFAAKDFLENDGPSSVRQFCDCLQDAYPSDEKLNKCMQDKDALLARWQKYLEEQEARQRK
jgi:hypothetical protein